MSAGGTDGNERHRAAASGERGLIYRFGDCALDARTLELSVRGETVRLEPKPLDLLVYLLRHAGEVVTKDELQDGVWPGRILSESVLTKTMAKLRQGLADEDQQIIKTVHGFGYRLVAPVTIETVGPVQTRPRLDLKAGDAPPLRPHWRLLESLGGGGFGDVWLAQHDKTGERRVFKFGLDARGLTGLKREITLFRVLRETHGERADFARLLDWNLEEPPYFIESEYASGGSLVLWAEAQGGLGRVSLDQRIDLIAQAAEALAAAHIAGVLHKDLKPSNLLVHVGDGGAPQIRLADFGSGRVVDLARIEQLEITRMGFTETRPADDSTSGTPFYFAPELIKGQQPTAQTDIYALGVILYQVIVGDLSRPLAPGWEREVEDELLREDIAATASGAAAQRLSDAAELARRLRALGTRRAARVRERAEAGDRERARIEAETLRHELDRARLRRRWATGVAAVFGVASIVAAVQWLQVRTARDGAERERAVAAAVNTFLLEDLLAAANPLNRPPDAPDVTVRQAMDVAESRVENRLMRHPAVLARLLTTQAELRFEFGDDARARALYDRAIALAESTPGGEDTAIRARGLRAALMITLQHFDEAQAELAKVMQAADHRYGAEDIRTLQWQLRLLEARAHQGANISQVAALRELRNRIVARAGEANVYAGEASLLAALSLIYGGRPDQAGEDAELAHRSLVQAEGEDHPSTLKALIALGHSYRAAGRNVEAIAAMEQAYELQRARYGPDALDSLYMQNELAFTLSALGEQVRAEALFRDLTTRYRKTSMGTSSQIANTLSNLAVAQMRDQRPDEALKSFDEAILTIHGDAAVIPQVATNVRRGRADVLIALSRFEEAAQALDDAEAAAAALPEQDWRRIANDGSRARLLIARGDTTAGVLLLDRTLGRLRDRVSSDSPLLASLEDLLESTKATTDPAAGRR